MKFDKNEFGREGRRAVYNGKEYKVASWSLPGMIKITSFDEEDMNDVRRGDSVEVSYTAAGKPFSVKVAGGEAVQVNPSAPGKVIISL